jgi:hypothetical protein
MSRKMIKAIGIDASVNAASWMLQVLGWGDKAAGAKFRLLARGMGLLPDSGAIADRDDFLCS